MCNDQSALQCQACMLKKSTLVHLKEGSDVMKEMIRETIVEKLDMKSLLSASDDAFIRIVDLGCSIGPNTFLAMQNVIEAVTYKYHSSQTREDIEFQVFFNDHVTNDFNTLFKSLPSKNWPYFAAAVPGSFYGQLFPSRSIHIAYSSYSLQWLSNAPCGVENKGRIHYVGASEEVGKAYAAQFESDMEMFLNARGKEIVPGGMVVLLLPGIPNGMHHSQVAAGFDVLRFFESTLTHMVNEGIVEESVVDSFNVPLFVASPEDMSKAVRRSGCFSIERMEIIESQSKIVAQADAKSLLFHLRATLEATFTKHFGVAITDEMFARTLDKCQEISAWMKIAYNKVSQLFLVLKRK